MVGEKTIIRDAARITWKIGVKEWYMQRMWKLFDVLWPFCPSKILFYLSQSGHKESVSIVMKGINSNRFLY